MAGRGRRPGDTDTREVILAAARTMFTEDGFNKTAVTGVARRAEVDPALIYHYFGTKVDLFVESMTDAAEFRDDSITDSSHADRSGTEVVAAFLRNWELDPEAPGRTFIAVTQAVASSPEATERLKQFIVERTWHNTDHHTNRRQSMVSSQLIGIAITRYILRLEPLASAAIDEVAAWYGPTIDQWMRDAKPSAPEG
ncbi:TetR/AcrR family transcriptional regulator [Nocardia pseudobrasiliensis]|nr:TetR family transcriptional regulator [Nocardia pseudobrasiliensis]